MDELLDNVIITDEFLEGMRVVGKALAKKCKGQYTYIKELKNKARYSYDFEYVREEEDKLAHCVEMKVLAEKLYKKAKHVRYERTHTGKTELIQRLIDGESIEAENFEVVASLSLCVDSLSPKEREIINKKFSPLFSVEVCVNDNAVCYGIERGKVYIIMDAGGKATFLQSLKEENKHRKTSGESLVQYNEEKFIGL